MENTPVEDTPVEWLPCKVRLSKGEAPALTAWVNGMGLIVYLEPETDNSRWIKAHKEYDGWHRYTVAGRDSQMAPTVEEAMARALETARSPGPAHPFNIARYRTENEWFAKAVILCNKKQIHCGYDALS